MRDGPRPGSLPRSPEQGVTSLPSLRCLQALLPLTWLFLFVVLSCQSSRTFLTSSTYIYMYKYLEGGC